MQFDKTSLNPATQLLNLYWENPKPYKSGEILVHGLLCCKNCKTMWNRDVNGATNIYKIAKNAILQKERPKYLCREGNKKEDNKSTKIKVNKSAKNKNSVTVDAVV